MLTLAGLKRYLVFFVIELETRRVTIAGIHPQPYGAWMKQLARNLTDPVEGCLRTASHLIHDRDPHERNHEGRDNQLLQRPPPPVNPDADVKRRERLGGLLSFYYQEAARGGG